MSAVLLGCGAGPAPRRPDQPAPSAAVDPAPPAPPRDGAPPADTVWPEDRPKFLTPASLQAIAALTAQAKQTYPDAKARFLRGLPPGQRFFVVATLASPDARENVFIAVTAIERGRIAGVIASEILLVHGFLQGEPYTFAEDDLLDWLISMPDGSEEGNLIGKYLDTLP